MLCSHHISAVAHPRRSLGTAAEMAVGGVVFAVANGNSSLSLDDALEH